MNPTLSLASDAVRPEALSRQWAALHEAAGLVAGLAGATREAAPLLAGACPESLRQASGWRLAMIAQGLADTAAILEGGIRALLVARDRGAPTAAAAEALWAEFVSARAALLAIAASV